MSKALSDALWNYYQNRTSASSDELMRQLLLTENVALVLIFLQLEEANLTNHCLAEIRDLTGT